MNWQTALAKLGARGSRKIGNNTYLQRSGENIAVRLHSTEILTFKPSGEAVVNTGGWKTVTTKARLNEYLPCQLGIGQTRGQWYWLKGGERLGVFSDGDTITADGVPIISATTDGEEAGKALRKRIASFAKLCGEKLPLPAPSGGDCWHCALCDSQGESMGDSFGDVSHLESHLEEGYCVPSLVAAALKEAGCGPLYFQFCFGKEAPPAFCGQTVRRAVQKFLVRRFQKGGKL